MILETYHHLVITENVLRDLIADYLISKNKFELADDIYNGTVSFKLEVDLDNEDEQNLIVILEEPSDIENIEESNGSLFDDDDDDNKKIEKETDLDSDGSAYTDLLEEEEVEEEPEDLIEFLNQTDEEKEEDTFPSW